MSNSSHEEPGVLAQVDEVLASLDGRRSRSWRLCEATRQVVGAAGVVVTVGYLSDVRTTLCATDEIAAAVESLQELVGEGPGFDAARSGEMVTCYLGDIRRSRWSELARAMWDELRDITVFAIPIRAMGGPVGVVTVYTNQRRSLRVAGAAAGLLVRAAGAALVAEGREQHASAEGLRAPWTSRVVVYQATGMVMAQLGIAAEDALSLLRSHAYAEQVDLTAIAGQVVARTLSFANELAGGT